MLIADSNLSGDASDNIALQFVFLLYKILPPSTYTSYCTDALG